jgi:hypothetical protein
VGLRAGSAGASAEVRLHRFLVISALVTCFVSAEGWCREKGDPRPADSRLIVAGNAGGTTGSQDKTSSGSDNEVTPPASQPKSRERPAREPAHRSSGLGRSQGGSKLFSNPSSHGVGIDGCMTAQAGGCGQTAANVFCRNHGFSGAREFKVGLKSRTYRQGDGDFCTGTCAVLTEIQCN